MRIQKEYSLRIPMKVGIVDKDDLLRLLIEVEKLSDPEDVIFMSNAANSITVKIIKHEDA